MLDPKKIGQLAIVFAIMNHEIGALSFLERTYFIATTERVGSVDGGCGYRLSGSHFHLRARERKHHRHRRRRRRSGIEVSGQHDCESRADDLAGRWVLTRAERVNRTR